MILSPYRFAAGGGDPNFANVVSLLHLDGADASTTITDVTGKTWTAAGNAQIDTAQSKYGGASLLLDGTGDYATTPSNSGFDFGTGDFTVECWIRPTTFASAGSEGIVCRDQIGGTRGWLMFTAAADSKLNFAAWIAGVATVVADTTAMSTGVFTHVAACREGGALRLYRGGVQVGNVAISGSVGAPAEPCMVGGLWGVGVPNPSNYYTGWIDDVRITKGVCRYPSGTTFTPPTAAFPDS